MTLTYKEQTLVDAKHKESDNVKHFVCQIEFLPYLFVSLGLEIGQKELTKQQLDWLTVHSEEIQKALEERENLNSIYFENMTKEQQKTVKRPYKLLDQFCKECNIQDS